MNAESAFPVLAEKAVLWRRDDHTLLRLHGKDAVSWFQTQTTNDVAALEAGQGCKSALLDRTGRVLALFSCHRWQDECWIILPKAQAPTLFSRVESHVISEEVFLEDTGGGPQFSLEGPRAAAVLLALMDGNPYDKLAELPDAPFSFTPMTLLGVETLVFRMAETGHDGFLLVSDPEAAEDFWHKLARAVAGQGGAILRESERRIAVLESGLPAPDPAQAHYLPGETPWEPLVVSRDKGCYLGQEVVARMRAYGRPKQCMTGLFWEGDAKPPESPGTHLYADGAKAGVLGETFYSATLGTWASWAWMGRNHREPGQSFLFTDAHGDTVHGRAKVADLPLAPVETRLERSRRLYDEAQALFEADAADREDAVVELLRGALLMNPADGEIAETLGVVLHRHRRTEEAVRVMRHLARLRPDSVMAHANLSVFYAALGRIAEAEEEKALAEQLDTRHALDSRAARRQAEEERQRLRAEAESRIGMFLEVLDIDPDDPMALSGMGGAQEQLERWAEAADYFRRAVAAQPDLSMAWLKLGRCLERLTDTDGARAAYAEGIRHASQKGDFMPLREMERRMAGLAET